MPCPKCGSTNIGSGGKYKAKKKSSIKYRLRCRDCKHSFILRTKTYRKKIPIKIREKIIKLYKTNKGYINKFDNLKKTTYSTREIAEILNVSSSFVWDIIKKIEKFK